MKKNILVTKASGVTEPFSIQKLRNSMERAGATSPEMETIIGSLTPKLYSDISTKKIYSEAFRMLRRHSKPKAARYSLKRGIMELGPSGFPFEKFIAKVFEEQGYSTMVDQVIQGKCVNHEIDVIARKENTIALIECKYRNHAGIAVDVKTPLYIHSRFEDVLEKGMIKTEVQEIQGWVATNSKFTTDAVGYALCKGIKILSWDFPEQNSLREIIDRYGLYPLTCLSSLSKQEKQWLLERNMVLVRDILKDEELLTKAGVSVNRIKSVKNEATSLCA